MRTQDLILIITTVIAGLTAGVFFAYSCSVIPGLGRLSDAGYLRAMQAVNRAILNPVFLSCFTGALLCLLLSTWIAWRQPALRPGFRFLLIATIAYAAGVFGVTVLGNVPLNDTLDKFDITGSSQEQMRELRSAFEQRWNRLNHVRTVFSMLSLLFAVLACLGRSGYRSGNLPG